MNTKNTTSASQNQPLSPKNDNSIEIKNHGIYESLVTALDKAVLGYYPFTFMLELGATLGTGTNQFFSTPLSSAGKTITSKFVRVLTEKVISGNCDDIGSLNYFQQNGLCMNEGTFGAVAFRTSVAFVAGGLSSFAFKGNLLFAVYDGLNAALYDTTNELKKIVDIEHKKKLEIDANAEVSAFKKVVDFLDAHGAIFFEGLDVFLKVRSEVAKLSAELIGKQASGVAREQIIELTHKLEKLGDTKFHGIIGGGLADFFTGTIKTGVDMAFYGALGAVLQGNASEGDLSGNQKAVLHDEL